VKGLCISGQLLAGKTTARRELCREGFWSPTTFTTRPPRVDDYLTETIRVEEFVKGVRSQKLAFPAVFRDALYAWEMSAFHRLISGSSGMVVVEVRPQTALALMAICPKLHAVWLAASDDVLEQRFVDRYAAEGWAPDCDALSYERFFAHRVWSDVDMVAALMRIADEAESR
jgi:guanylate kinase